jgi:NAD(P)-dependent dehydrogenase (short-subunit alcohol dehydrogenase family)
MNPRSFAPARTAVVTGASAGTGACIARSLARLGWRVGIGARREDRLEQVAKAVREVGGTPFACPLDVSEPRSVSDFFDATEQEFGRIDVVVSNAGICLPGLAHEVGTEDLEAEITTNLLGPMYVARRALPRMIEQRSGDLVFISSDTARAPRPFQAGYSASKAGLESYARTLAMELEGTGLRVTTIRLGPTATEFGRDWPPAMLRRVLESWKHFGLQRNLAFMDPDVVATAVVHAVTAPKGATLASIELQPEGPTRVS